MRRRENHKRNRIQLTKKQLKVVLYFLATNDFPHNIKWSIPYETISIIKLIGKAEIRKRYMSKTDTHLVVPFPYSE